MVFNKKIKFSFYSIYLNQLMCKIGRDEREKKNKSLWAYVSSPYKKRPSSQTKFFLYLKLFYIYIIN
jgi:hypothetical protein